MHRKFSSKQSLEFSVRHIHDLAGLISIGRKRCIRILLAGPLLGVGCPQTDILAGSADHDIVCSAFHLKGLALHIVVTEGIGVKGNADFLRLACLEGNTHKSLQFLSGSEDLGAWQGNVQLRDLIAVPRACIGDIKGHPGIGHIQVVVFKCGIAHTETEREADFLLGCLEIAVSHIDALTVFSRGFSAGIVTAHGRFAVFQREGFRQFSAGCCPAGKDPQHGSRCCLSAQSAVHKRFTVVNPRHLHSTAAGEDTDNVRIHGMELMNQADLVVGKAHVRAVQTFCFKAFRKTDIKKHSIGFLGHCDGLCLQLFVFFVEPFKAFT